MSHLLKYTEWQGARTWYSGDVSDLAHNSNAWWYPARLLGISPAEYILFLKDKYNAYDFSYCEETNVLLWKWSYQDCHRFTLYINNMSRKKHFMI